MKKKISYIAIIPARSGSERIKNKNLIKINGIPLIGLAVKNAIKTKLFSKVIISTDSNKYYRIAKKYGADDSAIRPKNISLSNSPDYEHIRFQINHFLKQHIKFDAFVILRPTNPFRGYKTIIKAVSLFEKNKDKINSLRAIKPVKEHPYKMWLKKDFLIKPLFPLKNKKGISVHSLQKKVLPEIYVQSAMIEISWVNNLLSNSISGEKIIPYLGNHIENFDINDPEDLEYMKILIKNNKNKFM